MHNIMMYILLSNIISNIRCTEDNGVIYEYNTIMI